MAAKIETTSRIGMEPMVRGRRPPAVLARLVLACVLLGVGLNLACYAELDSNPFDNSVEKKLENEQRAGAEEYVRSNLQFAAEMEASEQAMAEHLAKVVKTEGFANLIRDQLVGGSLSLGAAGLSCPVRAQATLSDPRNPAAPPQIQSFRLHLGPEQGICPRAEFQGEKWKQWLRDNTSRLAQGTIFPIAGNRCLRDSVEKAARAEVQKKIGPNQQIQSLNLAIEPLVDSMPTPGQGAAAAPSSEGCLYATTLDLLSCYLPPEGKSIDWNAAGDRTQKAVKIFTQIGEQFRKSTGQQLAMGKLREVLDALPQGVSATVAAAKIREILAPIRRISSADATALASMILSLPPEMLNKTMWNLLVTGGGVSVTCSAPVSCDYGSAGGVDNGRVTLKACVPRDAVVPTPFQVSASNAYRGIWDSLVQNAAGVCSCYAPNDQAQKSSRQVMGSQEFSCVASTTPLPCALSPDAADRFKDWPRIDRRSPFLVEHAKACKFEGCVENLFGKRKVIDQWKTDDGRPLNPVAGTDLSYWYVEVSPKAWGANGEPLCKDVLNGGYADCCLLEQRDSLEGCTYGPFEGYGEFSYRVPNMNQSDIFKADAAAHHRQEGGGQGITH